MKVLIAVFVIFNLANIALGVSKCYTTSCGIEGNTVVSCSAEKEENCLIDNSYCATATISATNFNTFIVKGCARRYTTEQQFCSESIVTTQLTNPGIPLKKPICDARMCSDDLCNSGALISPMSVKIVTFAAILTSLVTVKFAL